LGDEEDLKERNAELVKDRMEQARWYESLSLYGEAMRIYRALKDEESIGRLRNRIEADYRKKASDMERAGRYQDAANLYYLIGDSGSVSRMKAKDPALVILYDDKAGGISQLGSGMDLGKDGEDDRFFRKPNEEPERPPEARSVEVEPAPAQAGRTGLPVRMPKRAAPSSNRFCPYCGVEIQTKKEPRFCPSCGEEL
jgi:hypothetical protein